MKTFYLYRPNWQCDVNNGKWIQIRVRNH